MNDNKKVNLDTENGFRLGTAGKGITRCFKGQVGSGMAYNLKREMLKAPEKEIIIINPESEYKELSNMINKEKR